MTKSWDCPKCGKCFTSKRASAQHINDVHKGGAEPRKRPKPKPTYRERSLADISVEARLKQAMGEPLDALEESLIFD